MTKTDPLSWRVLHFREATEEKAITEAIRKREREKQLWVWQSKYSTKQPIANSTEINKLTRLPDFLQDHQNYAINIALWNINMFQFSKRPFCSPTKACVWIFSSPKGTLRQCWTLHESCTSGKQGQPKNYPSHFCVPEQLTAKNYSSPYDLDKIHGWPLVTYDKTKTQILQIPILSFIKD